MHARNIMNKELFAMEELVKVNIWLIHTIIINNSVIIHVRIEIASQSHIKFASHICCRMSSMQPRRYSNVGSSLL
jgi:hypothetical protein